MNGLLRKNQLLPLDENPDKRVLLPNDIRWFRHFFISFHSVPVPEIQKTVSNPLRRHDLGNLATDDAKNHIYELWTVNEPNTRTRRFRKKKLANKLNKLTKVTKNGSYQTKTQINQYLTSASPEKLAELAKRAAERIPLFPDTETEE